MRWNRNVLVVAAALSVAAATATAVPAAAHTTKIKAKIHDRTLTVTGTNGADTIALRLAAGDPSTLEVAGANVKRSRFDRIVVDAGGGDDTLSIDESNGVFTDTDTTTLNGESGDDTITGGSASETLTGGDGNDTVNGRRGADVALLGAGDDSFTWNPGDGSDVVEGQAGTDTLQFNGANIAEQIALTANGSRLRLTRDVANITMDNAGVEIVNVAALGGADTITLGDTTGTGLRTLAADFTTADGQPDRLVASGADVQASFDAGRTTLRGLSATAEVSSTDPADTIAVDSTTFTALGTDAADTIGLAANAPAVRVFTPGAVAVDATAGDVAVEGLGGDDTITAGNGLATLTSLTLDGGDGNDTLVGGDGADTLLGGDGNDTVNGGRGADTAFLGAGDDSFTWNPGDGSDVVEGQDGIDTLQFNGANIAEQIALTANGSRLRLTRDVANITMDNAGIEIVNVAALGGADTITLGDTTGTGLQTLAADFTTADGQPDRLVASGTNVQAAFAAGRTSLRGLSAAVQVSGSDPADTVAVASDTFTVVGTDAPDTIGLTANAPAVRLFAPDAVAVDATAAHLAVDGLGGDDTITAGNGLATLTNLTLDGGDGNDTLVGGDGADTLLGGDGNDTVNGGRGADTAFLGAGDDSFTWNPGDGSDVVEGQDGTDTMRFNGANIAEHMTLSANGPRLRFTRDVANIVMDTNGVETVDVRALGGGDTIDVGDLTGTDVTAVRTDLGAGDGQADRVNVDGTDGNDVITVSGAAGSAQVAGLAALVDITGADASTDVLAIDARAGDDAVTASALAADAIGLIVNGGDGDDVLVGGAGDDTLLGGPGDDVLNGGPGQDTLDGGPGANVVIQ